MKVLNAWFTSTWWACLGCLFCILMGCKPKITSVNLVKKGKPCATIVWASKPTRSAQLAAYELQHHVYKITNAFLPIVDDSVKVTGTRILVGESAATKAWKLKGSDFKPQEYLIRFLPGTIILMGKDEDDTGTVDYDKNWYGFTTFPNLFDDHATCYAVYDFLEKSCDVRWYNPTELGTVCPKKDTLKVTGGEIRRAPAFRHRTIPGLAAAQPNTPPGNIADSDRYNHWGYGLWHFESEEVAKIMRIAWCNLLGNWILNKLTSNPEFVKNLIWLDWKSWRGNDTIGAIRREVNLFYHRMRIGGEEFSANHAYGGYRGRFLKDDPNDGCTFVKQHPDYFAYGKNGDILPQMCFTNQGLIKQVVQDTRDYFTKGIKGKKCHAVAMGDYFSLSPDDYLQWCECNVCTPLMNQASKYPFDGRASDYVFGFINRVAAEIKISHPGKFLSTVAYFHHAYAPTNALLEPNIAVQLSLGVRYWWHPFAKDMGSRVLDSWKTEAQNRPLYAWLYYLHPSAHAHADANKPGNLAIKKYTKFKWHCFPGFFVHQAAEQIKMFHNYGIKGAYVESLGWDLEMYVTFKLLDDPTIDVDVLLAEYFDRYYGNASKPMNDVYGYIEHIYCNPNQITQYKDPDHVVQVEETAWGVLGTQPVMKKLEKLMQDVHGLAKTETEKKRVALFQEEVWEYMRIGLELYSP